MIHIRVICTYFPRGRSDLNTTRLSDKLCRTKNVIYGTVDALSHQDASLIPCLQFQLLYCFSLTPANRSDGDKCTNFIIVSASTICEILFYRKPTERRLFKSI